MSGKIKQLFDDFDNERIGSFLLVMEVGALAGVVSDTEASTAIKKVLSMEEELKRRSQREIEKRLRVLREKLAKLSPAA